jgi:AcrR family transcriptional regulator
VAAAGSAGAPAVLAAGSAREAAAVTPIAAGRQTPRRLRRAGEILAAAREAFLDKGFERSSVAEIAGRVGVVEGLVYTYFPTKRELLDEVLRGMYVPLIADVEAGFARIRGLRSRLRFLIWRHLRVYVEEPGLSRLVLHEVRTGPEYFKSVLHDLQVQYTAFLMRTVREAERDGELPPGNDAEMIRSLVYGGIEHRMWATLFGRGTIDVEVTADRYTELVLRGILAAASAPADPALERRIARLEELAGTAWPAGRRLPGSKAQPARRRGPP